jgi:nucleoside-diphosphate-sugar epimerase
LNVHTLVTGANGFLGSHVAEALAARGETLRLLLRQRSRLGHLEGVIYERTDGDVRDPESLAKAVQSCDTVVHIAGLTSALNEAQYRAVNAHGTAALVHAARDAGVRRFVYVSSLAAQGPSPDGSVQPPELPKPISPYGRTKLEGELAVLAESEKMSVVVVRLPVVYGPRDRALLPLFKLIKRHIMPLFGDGSNQFSWIHVYDAASAIALAATAPDIRAASVYTVADGTPHTWRELAETTSRVMRRRAIMLRVPPRLYALAGRLAGLFSAVSRRPLPLSPEKVLEMRQRYWVCDYARIADELGWQPTLDAEAGIASTVGWYREQRWL